MARPFSDAPPPLRFVRSRVRGAVDRVLVRVRGVLDLPSRSELVELSARLEQLDRRIGELADERVAALSRAIPALPAPEDPEVQREAEPDVEPAVGLDALPAPTADQPVADRPRRNGKRAAAARTRKK